MPPAIEPLWKARFGQAVAFSRDGRLLAAGGARGPVRMLDAQTGKLVFACEGSKSDIYKITFSRDGNLMAIGELDKRVSVCDATTGKLVGKLQVDTSEISNLQFTPATDQLIRAASKPEIDVFDLTLLKACTTVKPDPTVRSVLAALFSPGDANLLSVWKNYSEKQEVNVALFSWPGMQRVAAAQLEAELVYGAAFSHDSRFVALSFSSYSPPQVGCLILDSSTCKPLRTVLTSESCTVGFVSSNSLLIVSDAKGDSECCRLIDPMSGTELGRFEVGNRRIFEFDVSPDQKLLASATSSGAMVWDLSVVLSAFGLS